MESKSNGSGDGAPCEAQAAKLSYKFQRLREKLRAAIASGELSGKLPGERQLAKRFRVNAKTLSKALTDLAAEGVLDRSIGRGTFVKGAAESPAAGPDRWLLLADPQQAESAIVRLLLQANPASQVITDTSSLRPSFLQPFKAVIDLCSSTPESLLRDFVVRGMNVVLVDREPSTYSMHAVILDRALGASCLARDLMLDGHRQFFAVERRGQTTITDAIRRAAQRYAPESFVDIGFANDVPAALDRGATAFMCNSETSARQVRAILARQGIALPEQVSLVAVGVGAGEDIPCTGYFVRAEQLVETIVQLVRDTQSRRPTTLWLTGALVDQRTTAPIPVVRMDRSAVAGEWDSVSA